MKQARAEITPEAAVFNREGKLIYHGRIDNWYVEFGRSRPAPTTHELSDAIDAAIAGKPLANPAVKGVGCYISKPGVNAPLMRRRTLDSGSGRGCMGFGNGIRRSISAPGPKSGCKRNAGYI